MKQRKVLIIEDDKFILKAMKHQFEEEGCRVKTSNTSEGGFEILEKWVPDAIVLDIILPGEDGFAFMRKIRHNPKWNKIPIIVASNINEDPFIHPEEKRDYAEYIVKSDLDLDNIVKRVKSFFHD